MRAAPHLARSNHMGEHHRHDHGWKAALMYFRHAPALWRSPVNDAVVAEIAPRSGELVLDIGAGMGAATVSAARAGACVVAVEPTPFLRFVLQLRRRAHRDVSIQVISAGVERLPLSDGSVDAAWATNTMHHWVDQARGVSEIARVLRPGGRVFLVDENFEDPTHPEHSRFGTRQHNQHGFTMVNRDELGRTLAEHGLIPDAQPVELAGRPVIAVRATRAD